ncbi:MAG: hypothetical protein ACHQIM_18630, partial [Sphingobacteriales bacterium]
MAIAFLLTINVQNDNFILCAQYKLLFPEYLYMLAKYETKLSVNKQDFPAGYPSYQLTSQEIFLITQYYKQKKNTSIYVETYLPESFNRGVAPGKSNILKVQKQLREDEVAAYLSTNGRKGSEKSHVELLIITPDKIIKPLCWRTFNDVISAPIETNLWDFANSFLVPQADGSGCASLSLSYAKQLLKDNAKQLKELTLIVPYYNQDGQLNYFFVPSPQVLRYSQSSAYNKYLEALVMENTKGSFTHKNKIVPFETLHENLNKTHEDATKQGQIHIAQEASNLLQQLPDFRKRWKEAFDQMHHLRSLMKRKTGNLGLAYITRRMKKITTLEYEQHHNPGLNLLKEIKEKKQNAILSDDDLLSFFSDALKQLQFYSSAQLGYFLIQLGELIEHDKSYPFLLKFKHHFNLIHKDHQYMECFFLLNAKGRQILNGYIKQPIQFQRILDRLQHPKIDVLNVLSWLNALNIPEQEKFTFIKDRLSTVQAGSSVLDILLDYKVDYFDSVFEDKLQLSFFLMHYIGIDMLLPRLPQIITAGVCRIESMFVSQDDFYEFIDKHLPIEYLFDAIRHKDFFIIQIKSYFLALPESKRSTLLLKELNDPSSKLFNKLANHERYSRWFLELLLHFCNESEIETYLSTHRIFLLKNMMEKNSTYPSAISESLQAITTKMQFFSYKKDNALELY